MWSRRFEARCRRHEMVGFRRMKLKGRDEHGGSSSDNHILYKNKCCPFIMMMISVVDDIGYKERNGEEERLQGDKRATTKRMYKIKVLKHTCRREREKKGGTEGELHPCMHRSSTKFTHPHPSSPVKFTLFACLRRPSTFLARSRCS